MVSVAYFILGICRYIHNTIVWIDADINECATNNGQCSQICTNSIGSFTCSCESGYLLNADNLTCTGKHPSELFLINYYH